MTSASHEQRPSETVELALVALAVALAPMNYLRLEEIYLTLSDVTAMMAFTLMLANRRVPLRFFGSATGLWLASFACLTGGLLLGSLVNGDPITGLLIILQYTYSLILLPLIIAARPREQIILLLKVFVLSVAAIMAHGAYLIHLADSPDPRLVSGAGRLRSMLERENASGAIAAIAATMAIWLFLAGRMRGWALALILPVILYGLLLTGSNSGLMTLLAGIASLVIASRSARLIIAAASAFALSAVAVVFWGEAFLPETFQTRVLPAIMSGDLQQAGTFGDRFLLMQEALGISERTLIIGLGAGQYREVSDFGTPVHNIYLLLLSEGGLTSLLGLAGLFATGIYLGWAAMQDRRSYTDGALTIAVVLIFAVLFNSVTHFYGRFWNVPLILTIALSASTLKLHGFGQPWPRETANQLAE